MKKTAKIIVLALLGVALLAGCGDKAVEQNPTITKGEEIESTVKNDETETTTKGEEKETTSSEDVSKPTTEAEKETTTQEPESTTQVEEPTTSVEEPTTAPMTAEEIFIYEFKEDGTVKITGLRYKIFEELIIPETLAGRAVTEIGGSPLRQHSIPELHIPSIL